MSKYSEMSAVELETKLQAAKRTQMVVGVIFGLIILAWIVLGYWRENTAVFAITVALAVILTANLSSAPRQMAKELEKRNSEEV
ncbi:MAG: hypothetical protein AAF614_31535 [Chloroflexota bacterium]